MNEDMVVTKIGAAFLRSLHISGWFTYITIRAARQYRRFTQVQDQYHRPGHSKIPTNVSMRTIPTTGMRRTWTLHCTSLRREASTGAPSFLGL